tara:strand:+ start:552 stop:1427 length:876 start_codon:yes stop_codon:yes gene_type:complete
MDQADTLRKIANKTNFSERQKEMKREKNNNESVRIIAVTSGKGGVGKTNVVANLAFALEKHDKNTLIFDADTGLGNVDILLGLAPKYNLKHVLKRERDIKDVIINHKKGISVLPAASGIQELAELNRDQRLIISEEFDSLADNYDYILLDTGAGISSNVTHFCASAHNTLVVVSPEPTSLTDAYALIKVLFLNHNQKQFKLLINLAKSDKEATEVYRQLSAVIHKFLPLISVDYIGYVLYDENMAKSVRMQKSIVDFYPYSKASKGFIKLAEKITGLEPALSLTGNKINLF